MVVRNREKQKQLRNYLIGIFTRRWMNIPVIAKENHKEKKIYDCALFFPHIYFWANVMTSFTLSFLCTKECSCVLLRENITKTTLIRFLSSYFSDILLASCLRLVSYFVKKKKIQNILFRSFLFFDLFQKKYTYTSPTQFSFLFLLSHFFSFINIMS